MIQLVVVLLVMMVLGVKVPDRGGGKIAVVVVVLGRRSFTRCSATSHGGRSRCFSIASTGVSSGW